MSPETTCATLASILAATTSAPATVADKDVVMLIVYVGLALGFSFLCSVAEAVLLSITPAYIEEQRELHPARAALLKRVKQDSIDRSLAAILTLNTIANTAGAVGAGSKAAIVFGSAWFGVFSAVLTLAILFLSEIIPKTIGAVYWPSLAPFAAVFVRGLTLLLAPIVWVSECLTRVIARDSNVHIFSRNEFIAMARAGEESGHIHSREAQIIRNLFQLRHLRIKDIMTPRMVVAALPETSTVGDAAAHLETIPFSRLPVYLDDMDTASGFVLKDEILLRNAKGETDTTLAELKRDLLFVPDSASLAALLETLRQAGQHIAMVTDEYGGTIGLVTLEDLLETLMGMEIVDETDQVADLRAWARKKGRERANQLGMTRDTTD